MSDTSKNESYVNVGCVRIDESLDEEGQPKYSFYVGLGNKSKDPKYIHKNTTVEVIIRNDKDEVVHRQVDGFLNLSDPRKTSKNPSKVPPDIKYNITAKKR